MKNLLINPGKHDRIGFVIKENRHESKFKNASEEPRNLCTSKHGETLCRVF